METTEGSSSANGVAQLESPLKPEIDLTFDEEGNLLSFCVSPLQEALDELFPDFVELTLTVTELPLASPVEDGCYLNDGFRNAYCRVLRMSRFSQHPLVIARGYSVSQVVGLLQAVLSNKLRPAYPNNYAT